ncbi:MAG: peptidoglycan-associated lipoprotein Pal [Proteobacteria bacterium]|nr:peptidoglycan-associated lipoprotein Pal [Pseudomonadota bacterium]
MKNLSRIALLSAVSILLAACSDPPVDDSAANKATVVDGAMGNGMSSNGLKGMDLNALGAMSALEDDKNYAVGGVQPTIYFGLDQFSLDDKAQAVVSHYVRYLSTKPSLPVVLEGNCDERGSSEYNMALGERRAKAVRDALVVSGIATSRIKVVSFGEEKPASEGHDETAWALNRRVDMKFPQQ